MRPCGGLYHVVVLVWATLDSVRLSSGVEDLLRELRSHVGSVHNIHTRTFSPLSGTARVSRYQSGFY